MGRPKIKTIETAIELDKVKLPEEQTLPELDETAEELVEKKTKGKLAAKKKSAKSSVAKKVNKHSKRYLKLQESLSENKSFPIEEALGLVKKTSNVNFDATVEAHINLRIDPAKQEQQIRTTASLPHGNGKKLKVLVFGAKASSALKETGAKIGDETTLAEIEKGKIDFDKVVATAEWMPKLAKVAKILGPKGLMPNPKSGTVTTDPEKTVEQLSSGLVEIKTENSPIIHASIGKVSFKEKDLEENVKSLISQVKAAKPTEVKKELVKDVYLTSTMGPSVKLDLSSIS